ncbi:MAG: hypothetical protein Q9M29_00630 [Mariprofundaceae bacterium]|nr:hypothetical protein [Mariprofundaceae bacterium]
MRAALWSKLKSAGPVGNFDEEMQRFIFWLPNDLRPMLAVLRRRVDAFNREADPARRLEMEIDTVKELQAYPAEGPEQRLVIELLAKVESLLLQSKATRRAALRGEPVDSAPEERMLDDIRHWLECQRQPERRGLAGWLMRLMVCWQRQRASST